jgi:flagellar hook-basal body complex protein FliE
MCILASITVRINDNTKQRMAKYGKWGESFDEVLNHILDELDKKVSKAEEKALDDLANAALSASRKRGKT